MARNYMEIGPTPVDMPCAQLGVDADFEMQNKIECVAFKHQLERLFPTATFTVKTFPYEREPYREVCVVYDDADEQESELAYEIEANIPVYWDEEAIKELKAVGYRHLEG